MANYGGTSGVFGDPLSPGWEDQNLVTITGPNGESWRVNKRGAADFQAFVNDLAATGYTPRSSGGFNYRKKRGGNTLSEHAYGNAIDINAGTNAMGSSATDMPSSVAELAARHNLEWGGNWSNPDPMHFEWKGDGSVINPQQAAVATQLAGSGGTQGPMMGGSGSDMLAPERESVIKQLLGGDIKGAWGTFKGNVTGEGLGLPQQVDRYTRAAGRLYGMADAMNAGMQNANAPVSWTQVLAGALGNVAGAVNERRAGAAQTDIHGQLAPLLSSGNLDPATIAKIMALDPQLGQQLQVTQNEFNQRSALQEDQQAAAIALENLRSQNDAMLAGLSGEEKTALMTEIEAAGFVPGTPEYEQFMRDRLTGVKAPGAEGTFDLTIGADGSITMNKGAPVSSAGTGVDGNTTIPSAPVSSGGASVGGPGGPAGAPVPALTGTPAVPNDLLLKESTPVPGQVRVVDNGQMKEVTVPGSKQAQDEAIQKQVELDKQTSDWARSNTIIRSLDEARIIAANSSWATGLPGQILSQVGGTAARDLSAKLKPVLAIQSIQELQRMRDQSPTGGALGNVSDRDMELLQSTLASLDQAQSQEQVLASIDHIQAVYEAITTGKNFEAVMGYPPQGNENFIPGSQPAPSSGQVPAIPTVNTQAEYNNLPSGTIFVDAADGKRYKKP